MDRDAARRRWQLLLCAGLIALISHLPILILLSLISAGAACQDAAPASPFSGAFCRILGLRPGEKSYIIER